MSTTLMWLLLVVVVAVIVTYSALSKKRFSTQDLAIIGLMAALSFVAYEFFRIPNLFGTGSSFHLGNTFTALTALLLDGVCGGLAGAIGLSIADIAAGSPGYAITTFILKFIIGLTCGFVAHRVLKIREHQPSEGASYYLRVIGAAFSGLLLNVITDPILGYFRNVYIFGLDKSIGDVWLKIAGGVTLVNAITSGICAVIFFLALRPALKNRLK